MTDKKFEVFLADDQWGRQIHHQLRYQVFCLETGYEDPTQFPNGEERDEWDDSAAHLLVRRKDTGQWVAAMRLVLPFTEALPIERRTTIVPALRRDILECAEISRLCMVGHYRRRRQGRIMMCNDEASKAGGGVQRKFQAEMKRRQSTAEILHALLNAAVAISMERGIDYWYMLVTRSLAKILGYALPMNLQQAGPPCWHRGERHPFFVDVGDILRGLLEQSGVMPSYRRHSELVAPMRKVVGAENF